MPTFPSPVAVATERPKARAVRAIRELIDHGKLAAGMPLPSDRVISERIHIPRATVRRALAELQSQGVIRNLGGRTRVLATADHPRFARIFSRSVIVLAPELEQDGRHQQSGWTEWITHGSIQALRARGLHVMSLNPQHLEQDDLLGLLEDHPVGVLVPEVFRGLRSDPLAGLPVMRRMREVKVPAVVYGGDPQLDAFDRVTSDHEAGCHDLTRHLLASGRRRPMMLIEKPGDSYWLNARRAGYQRAMREAGLEPLPPLILPPFPAERTPDADFFESVSRYVTGCLLEPLSGPTPIDAILAMSDGKTFPIARACRLLGKRVHQDVAIVGYDNYWLDSWERQFIDAQPLATVDKCNFELGQTMAQLLLDRAAGTLPPGPQVRVVRPKLVVPV